MTERDVTSLIQARLAALLLLLLPVAASVHGSSCFVDSETAMCRDVSIVKIPHNLPDTITHLNLRRNLIQAINRRDLLRYRRLQQLFISSNQLSSVDEDAFLTLRNLTTVDLSQNLITHVSNGIFQHNMKLSDVKLARNNLRLDPSSHFLISSSLQHLDLTFCGIQQISSMTFSMMVKLKILLISGNNIVSLHPDSFNHNSLKSIHIDSTEEVKPLLPKLCRDGVKVYVSFEVNFCVIAESVVRLDLHGTNPKGEETLETSHDNQNTSTFKTYNGNVETDSTKGSKIKTSEETVVTTTSEGTENNLTEDTIHETVETTTTGVSRYKTTEESNNEIVETTTSGIKWNKTTEESNKETVGTTSGVNRNKSTEESNSDTVKTITGVNRNKTTEENSNEETTDKTTSQDNRINQTIVVSLLLIVAALLLTLGFCGHIVMFLWGKCTTAPSTLPNIEPSAMAELLGSAYSCTEQGRDEPSEGQA